MAGGGTTVLAPLTEGPATVEEVGCAIRAATGWGGCRSAVARIIEVHRGAAV